LASAASSSCGESKISHNGHVCHFQFFINSQQRTDNELDVDEDFAEGGSDEDTDGLEPNSEEDAEEDED
jgi:hypothetical protein